VAKQDRWRQRALHVPDKANGFAGHDRTVNALADMLAAAGLRHPEELQSHHLVHGVSSTEIRQFDQVHRFLKASELLSGDARFPIIATIGERLSPAALKQPRTCENGAKWPKGEGLFPEKTFSQHCC